MIRHVFGISAVDSGLVQIWLTRCPIRSVIRTASVLSANNQRGRAHVYYTRTFSRSFGMFLDPHAIPDHSNFQALAITTGIEHASSHSS